MPDINSLGRDSSASDTNEPAATGSTSALNTRNEASSRNVDDPSRDSSASDTNEPAATGSTSALNTRNEASSRNVDDPTYMTPSRPAPRPPQPSRPSQTSTGQSANGVHRWQDALGPHGSDSGSSANR